MDMHIAALMLKQKLVEDRHIKMSNNIRSTEDELLLEQNVTTYLILVFKLWTTQLEILYDREVRDKDQKS